MNIPVLIVEDNKSAAEALEHMLENYKELKVVNSVGTLAEAYDVITKLHPALLFLDVELPDGNGVDFWEQIRSRLTWNAYAIFYTAYNQYAIKALRANAHDYLLKPVVKADVEDAMHRFFLHCAQKFAENKNILQHNDEQTPSSTILVVDSKNNKVAVKPADVGFFHYQQEHKVWEVYCADGNRYVLRHGTNSTRLLQICPDFEQVHKSYIINTKYLQRIEDNNIVMMEPFSGIDNIQISRLYRTTLCSHFCQL